MKVGSNIPSHALMQLEIVCGHLTGAGPVPSF